MNAWKRLLLPLLFTVLLLPASALALQEGETAPLFSAPASLAGEHFSFSLEEALGEGPVVVYFYPSAFTHGCDLEAHTFSTHMDQFEAAGASVIGISADSIARLDAFSKDPAYCAGDFPVASDPTGKVAALFGLEMTAPRDDVTGVRGIKVTHGFIPRTTFVLDSNGRVLAAWSSAEDGLSPVDHVLKSLELVQQLAAR